MLLKRILFVNALALVWFLAVVFLASTPPGPVLAAQPAPEPTTEAEEAVLGATLISPTDHRGPERLELLLQTTTTTTTTASPTTTTTAAPTTTTTAAPTTTTTAPPTTTTTAPPATTPAVGGPEHGSGACGGDLPPCFVLQRESGGDIRIWNGSCYAPTGHTGMSPCGVSSASGKWQFVRGTWAGFGGYLNAAEAPESVQDERARQLWAGGSGCGHWAAC